MIMAYMRKRNVQLYILFKHVVSGHYWDKQRNGRSAGMVGETVSHIVLSYIYSWILAHMHM